MASAKRDPEHFRQQLWSRVRWQRALGFLFFIPFDGPLIFIQRYILGYKIENLKETRALYAELMKDRSPLMICSNHMTYLDSSLLIYAFSNHFKYWLNFRTLTWNLPAVEYAKNPFFFIVGFLSKCLFIDRKGFSTHQIFFETCAKLLKSGEPVMIFPEGRRSRTGRFDDRKLANGVGKIISQIPQTRVLCAYLRSENQTELAGFPKLGSKFHVRTKLLNLSAHDQERETVNGITRQIADCIQSMEQEYFNSQTRITK